MSNLLDNLFSFLDGRTEEDIVQIREIVPIEAWLENPFYCGFDGVKLKDFWKQELTDFYNSNYIEWILYGSLGGGKSTAAVYAMIRKIYELSCYDSIPTFLGLLRTSVVYMIYFSVGLTQAKRTGFGKLLRVVDDIPYFINYFPRDSKISSEIKYSDLSIIYGSSTVHQLGLDLFGMILDEGDFFKVTYKGAQEEHSKARELYTSTTNRRKLRFAESSGLSILISSPAYGTDFVETRIAEVEKDQSAKITNVLGYQVLKDKFEGPTFAVFPGDQDIDPMILDNRLDYEELAEFYDISHEERLTEDIRSDLERIIEIFDVPETFRSSFNTNLIKAVQDILGKSIQPLGSFMSAPVADKCISPYLKHPFSRRLVSLSTKRDVSLDDLFSRKFLLPHELPRFIHIDQSVTTDRTGVASVVPIAQLYGSEYDHRFVYLAAVEWMLAISPPREGEIPILRIAEFIVFLRDLGYNIARVTMDSYQSRASLQYLDSEGIDAGLLSVDKDDQAYVDLRNYTINQLIYYYDYHIYIKEIINLLWDRRRRKVDHPAQGSKDVTDSVAGALQSLIVYGYKIPEVYVIEESLGETVIVDKIKLDFDEEEEVTW